jgi:hypothetical protein
MCVPPIVCVRATDCFLPIALTVVATELGIWYPGIKFGGKSRKDYTQKLAPRLLLENVTALHLLNPCDQNSRHSRRQSVLEIEARTKWGPAITFCKNT